MCDNENRFRIYVFWTGILLEKMRFELAFEKGYSMNNSGLKVLQLDKVSIH
jgi:hypothetical protein